MPMPRSVLVKRSIGSVLTSKICFVLNPSPFVAKCMSQIIGNHGTAPSLSFTIHQILGLIPLVFNNYYCVVIK